MTSKVIEGPKSLSNFSVNLTLPLMDGPLMLPNELCVFLSDSPSRSRFRSFDQITTLFLDTP